MAETGSMTRQELVAFAQKMEEWGKGLTAKEQDFLEELLARAMSAGSGEVEGFMTKTDRKPDIIVSSPPELSMDMGNIVAGRFSGFLLGEM